MKKETELSDDELFEAEPEKLTGTSWKIPTAEQYQRFDSVEKMIEIWHCAIRYRKSLESRIEHGEHGLGLSDAFAQEAVAWNRLTGELWPGLRSFDDVPF